MATLIYPRVDECFRDPEQPRKDFEPLALQELSDSISRIGLQQPIQVVRNPQGSGYLIRFGERRWRASKLAHKETIAAILIDGEQANDDSIKFSSQLSENLNRSGLNPVEEAEFIQQRIDQLVAQGDPKPKDTVAKEAGKSNSWVSKKLALMAYPEEIRSLARSGKVRDFEILKKLSKLRNARLDEAISLIKQDQFNAKEFFKRKRGTALEAQADNKTSSAPKKEIFKMVMDRKACVNLIEQTEYKHTLDEQDTFWRTEEQKVFKQYLDQFQKWAASRTS